MTATHAPRQSREERRAVLVSAMRDIQFGALIVPATDALEAFHLPMLVREYRGGVVIEGHVAVGNSIWRAADGGDGLAIFQGPQAYVHPGWYETKRTDGEAVPTWNYVAVHACGRRLVERDPAWLRRHLDDLTRANVSGWNEPWSVSDAPDGYIEAMLRAIVGVRMEVTALNGVWKMIQHYPAPNRLGTIAGLSAGSSGDRAVAAVMEELECRRP